MKSLLKVIPLHKNEHALIKKALKQNRDAQRVLFDSYAPKMLSVCRSYISDLQHAEEAMLNGFFKVFKKLHTYNGEGSFEGWIRRVMVRESLSYLRQKKRIDFLTDEVVTTHPFDDTIENDLGVNHIQTLIDALPEGYRVVFVMYAIEGYKHHEIAALLHISEGTSKSQLFKARKLLQQHLLTFNNTSYGTN